MKYCLIDTEFNKIYFGETPVEAIAQAVTLTHFPTETNGHRFDIQIPHYKRYSLPNSYSNEYTVQEATIDVYKILISNIQTGKLPIYKFYQELC